MSARFSPLGAARLVLGAPAEHGLPAWPTSLLEQLGRGELDPERAHLAWEIGRLAAAASPDDPAAALGLAGLALLVLDAEAQGATRLPLEADALDRRLVALEADAPLRDAVRGALARVAALSPGDPFSLLVGRPGEVKPLIVEAGHLYAERTRALEVRLAGRIAARIGGAPEASTADSLDAAIEALATSPGQAFRLTDEQLGALRVALGARFSVLTGGPGTGKTSIVLALLRLAVALGQDPAAIALAAPTGKAADRMRQALEAGLKGETSEADARLIEAHLEPRTLHRLLGYSPRRGVFRRDARDPLAETLVVVDEGSMIDLALMESLFDALRPDARLVLLGDAEQLPSVAAGAVFRDLAPSDGAALVPGARLTKSHRMDPSQPEGAHVLTIAGLVREGRAPIDLELRAAAGAPPPAGFIGRLAELPAELDALAGVWSYEVEGPGRAEFLARWHAARFAPHRAAVERTHRREGAALVGPDLDSALRLSVEAERYRLLAVTRRAGRPTGVEALSRALHLHHAALLGRSPGPANSPRLLAGEPVTVHRNDYTRGLFNGDQGLLLWTAAEDESPRLSAVFRRGEALSVHPLEAVLPIVELGFATTVHKAQGSEHELVVLVLPDADAPRIWTREILYTALTRARRAVLLIGEGALLARAARRPVIRSSGLRERLAPEP